MDRLWFFTWRTYGTWLPGEEGFVGAYESITGERRSENVPGRPAGPSIPVLTAYVKTILKQAPVYLEEVHAKELLRQMFETANIRGWRIDAVAILATHVHVVFGVPGDPKPSGMLRDWKSYGSRALNREFGRQEWWADRGSKRALDTESSWIGAICYVRDQDGAWIIWLSDEARAVSQGYGRSAIG